MSPSDPPARSTTLPRREFIAAAAAALAGCRTASALPTQNPALLRSRPGEPRALLAPGTHPLGLGGERDGFVHLPPSADRAAPLLMLLHGAGQEAAEWDHFGVTALCDAAGVVLCAPDSRGVTWGAEGERFGPDVAFIDRALARAFDACRIDPKRIVLGGFSDGASYSLSLGVANGALFRGLAGFSPGYFIPPAEAGHPRVFLSHGTRDRILPFEFTHERLSEWFRSHEYRVQFASFDGGHTVPSDIAERAIAWSFAA